MDFAGKNVVITGAASGLGAAMTERFAVYGADLALLDIDLKGLERVKETLPFHQGKVSVYRADVTNYREILETGKKILRDFGSIDVLVNSAGGGDITLGYRELDEVSWNKQIDLNLNGVFNCCKMVLETMIQQKSGKIINISSVAGLRGGGLLGRGAYAAAKAGVIGLTKALAREVGEFGIRVNAVAPGFHLTPLTEKYPEEKLEAIKASLPLKCSGDPQKLAELVVFLASDKAQFITGSVITADGGYAMH
ncbi:MAG: SDR family NAD(P)-dependent oxidoreductase [Peptococcaceae bacterium]|jgi:NAD(P)-dependent dehydrogenase (short-subunit alcohol dehydrogenase family)|nr:SDR family oxidoreductase [Peptococcaceae bacterium]MDH7526307.1 SDR family NAD(P)-dependent oxidoreductase [Peptococcaceae bacterium]